MKTFLNRIDKLEIAYTRNNKFETTLKEAPHQECYDELDESLMYIPDDGAEDEDEPETSSEQTSAVIDSWFDDDKEHRVNISLDDELMQPHYSNGIITIGDWRFTKGVFAGPNSAYKYNYLVEYTHPDGQTIKFGYLYYVTYLLRRDHIYLRLHNTTLYGDNYWMLIRKFERDFKLDYCHISKVDIALDSTLNTSKVIHKLMKTDKSIEWVINGHVVEDRDKTIRRLFWVTSGSLNDPDANRSMYIKQKEGLTTNCYDKTMEIDDESKKEYQIEEWDDGDSQNIYRSEVRLTLRDVINYNQAHGLNNNDFRQQIEHNESRFTIFKELSRKMIRWNYKRHSYDITSLLTTDVFDRKHKNKDNRFIIKHI